MRPTLLLLALLASACGMAPVTPVDAGSTDAGPDAGTDAGLERWATRFQPLLWNHCADCHRADGGQVPFTEAHAVLLQPSTLCPGQLVGECVGRAVQAQATEGTRCRTYVVTPFHREGWVCLTTPEIDELTLWVDAGFPEH